MMRRNLPAVFFDQRGQLCRIQIRRPPDLTWHHIGRRPHAVLGQGPRSFELVQIAIVKGKRDDTLSRSRHTFQIAEVEHGFTFAGVHHEPAEVGQTIKVRITHDDGVSQSERHPRPVSGMEPIGRVVGEEWNAKGDMPLEAGRVAEAKLETGYPVRPIDPHSTTQKMFLEIDGARVAVPRSHESGSPVTARRDRCPSPRAR
jgi:hypothetical protein